NPVAGRGAPSATPTEAQTSAVQRAPPPRDGGGPICILRNMHPKLNRRRGGRGHHNTPPQHTQRTNQKTTGVET
ncbi:hypothetical protein Pcinc_029652, partial [Petrolisthes cinctipes]